MTRAIDIVAMVGAVALLAAGALAQTPPAQLNTINDLGVALRACWVPPPVDQARPAAQITVMMSLRRNGEVLGQPKITFESEGATDDERLAYRIAVADMLKRCSPLPLTDGFGSAIAGHFFTIRLDNRTLKPDR